MARIGGLAACAVSLGLACTLAGCSGGPAPITHVVFIKLNDPGESEALIRESRERLATIPGVVGLSVGRHFETGRATVDGDYDAGMTMGFADAAAYRAYVEHPVHVELVKKWRPRAAWFRVYDVGDETVR